MKSVGVKILKNKLSYYLQAVRAGDVVYVTDRDEVIAEIRQPTVAHAHGLSRWETLLNDLDRKGLVVRARSHLVPPVKTKRKVPKEKAPSLDVMTLLSATREDR